MKATLLGLIALVAFQALAQAESIVSKYCAGTTIGSIPPALFKFSTEAQRTVDPAAYVQAMDKLISNGPFKKLLACRDQLKADPLFIYGVRPLAKNESQIMRVERKRESLGSAAQVSVELLLNLKFSPQKAFFTYIHELTHVCQAYHWADLQEKFDIVQSLPQDAWVGGIMGSYPVGVKGCPDLQPAAGQVEEPMPEIKADYYRHQKLGEVEAFYNMTRAYQYYAGVDSSFCHGSKDDGGGDIYRGYLEMEKMIDQGYFAQSIIEKYLEDELNKEEIAPALFDFNAPQRLYPDNVLRPTLNTSMLNLIKSRGFPLVEPEIRR